MLPFILIGTVLVAITVIIHGTGSTALLRRLGGNTGNGEQRGAIWTMRILTETAILLLVLHVVEIVLWAAAYLLLLPPSEVTTFEEAVYFSFVTFTTLGYGDITLSGTWRILSGIEALNGILLVGWSTALLFAVMQRIWQNKLSTGVEK